MAVTQKIVTSNFNVNNAKEFVYSFNKVDVDNYYMFVGKHTPYAGGDSNITIPDNSVQSSLIDVYNNMIFAKRIDDTDVIHMVAKYTWTTGTTYTEYSHLNTNLINDQFYTVVDDITEYNVYKCLSNNGDSVSTVAPSRVGSPSDLDPVITGDGYMWKYMYTITKTDYDKFSTNAYIPVTANTVVMSSAVPGTIETVKITNGGSGYDNYIANAAFQVGDISVSGINTIYGAPSSAVGIDNFYTGGMIKITSGVGAEQFRKIVDYDGISSQKKFFLDAPFSVSPQVGDTYEIYPYVFVWGDGNETIAAEGRIIIDPVANSVVEVEMLNVGAGYRQGSSTPGQTPNTNLPTIDSILIDVPILVSSAEDFLVAQLTPIISPQNGHGSDPYEELFANRVCISTKYTGTESGQISIDNDFRQVGLIKNPKFTNVDLILKPANTTGSFSINETVYQFKQKKLLGSVETISGNNIVIKTNQGKISSTIDILNGGTGYDNTTNNELVFDNSSTGGSGAAAIFANNGSGTITSVTVSSQGSLYDIAPVVSVNITGAALGSSAQFLVSLANPNVPSYDDSFEPNDIVLINNSNTNLITTVSSVPTNYQINLNANVSFSTSNAEVSAVDIGAVGIVTSISSGQITLSNVTGTFRPGSKIMGLSSSATSVIGDSSSIQINDKAVLNFNIGVQLTRLVGDFSSGGTTFENDEKIIQNSLISYARPEGVIHHAEINGGTDDDILHISNEFGIFNLDNAGVRTILGEISEATLDNLSNKYTGDFVKDSGTILYIENIDAVTRNTNKSETIKLILEF